MPNRFGSWSRQRLRGMRVRGATAGGLRTLAPSTEEPGGSRDPSRDLSRERYWGHEFCPSKCLNEGEESRYTVVYDPWVEFKRFSASANLGFTYAHYLEQPGSIAIGQLGPTAKLNLGLVIIQRWLISAPTLHHRAPLIKTTAQYEAARYSGSTVGSDRIPVNPVRSTSLAEVGISGARSFPATNTDRRF